MMSGAQAERGESTSRPFEWWIIEKATLYGPLAGLAWFTLLGVAVSLLAYSPNPYWGFEELLLIIWQLIIAAFVVVPAAYVLGAPFAFLSGMLLALIVRRTGKTGYVECVGSSLVVCISAAGAGYAVDRSLGLFILYIGGLSVASAATLRFLYRESAGTEIS